MVHTLLPVMQESCRARSSSTRCRLPGKDSMGTTGGLLPDRKVRAAMELLTAEVMPALKPATPQGNRTAALQNA
jgi:hypothetical protein